ncbi:MAG: nucleotide sugar dehydrogenase [SAR202 cluster bacterium]|nr:nucleotide sugar dehydrogenase [SAR202 cluster bacterium]
MDIQISRDIATAAGPSAGASRQPGEVLLEKIRSRQAVVSVIGLGYVGLPLAVAYAEAGFRVIGVDLAKGRVDAVNRADSYIEDVPSETLRTLTGAGKSGSSARRAKNGSEAPRLRATTDHNALEEADAVIICVPTPLGKTRDPDVSYIISATDQIAQHLRPGMAVVLESTTFPGTTEEIVLPRLENANGRSFKAGTDFFLAFSPERIDPGRTDWTLHTTPKVIGGVTPRCMEVIQSLYQTIVKQVVPVSCPQVAEMTKLLENTFRAANIGLVNEIAIMCDRLGLDVWEVINAAKTKPFGFMPFYPGPGLGGHCIPKDPLYLAWKLRTLNYNPRFIQVASEINLGMPAYVLDKISDALNKARKPVNGSKVLVLGVAYKANVADTRDSPALDLIQLLHEKQAQVSYNDPHVPRTSVPGLALESVELTQQRLREADCVVITATHSAYDIGWIVENSQLIVDTRNATQGIRAPAGKIVKL